MFYILENVLMLIIYISKAMPTVVKIQVQQQEDNQSQQLSPVSQQNQGKTNNGLWSTQENLKYTIFLEFYKKKFRKKSKYRNALFFRNLSIFVQSRSYIQCRSHHQKLQLKYETLPRIIKAIKERLSLTNYRESYLSFKTVLDTFNFDKSITSQNSKSVQVQTLPLFNQNNLLVCSYQQMTFPHFIPLYHQQYCYPQFIPNIEFQSLNFR